jgi:Zn-finger nucleic acid-binding protein
MEALTIEDITVQRCTECHGLWFHGVSHKELKKIHGSEAIDIGYEENSRAFDRLKGVACPECGKRMQRISDTFKPHLHYDACPAHDGFFFDAGEFRDFKRESVLDFFKDLSWYFRRRDEEG